MCLILTDVKNEENEFKVMMKNVEKTAEGLGLTLTRPRVTKRQCHSSIIPSGNIENYYRRSVFLPYLDSLIQDLSERFSKKNQASFELFNLHPKNMRTLTRKQYEHSLELIFGSYSILLENFMEEGPLWYDLWTHDNASAETLSKVYLVDLLNHIHAFFLPNVNKAIQMVINLPPTTCTIKKSFRISDISMKRLFTSSQWLDSLFFLSKIGKQYLKDLGTVHSFTRNIIREKKDALKLNADLKEHVVKSKRQALMDLLLNYHMIDKDFTEEDIQEEVDTFAFEGHDTTAMGLSWTLFMIGLYPHVQEKIHEELDMIFGDDDRNIDTENLKEMKYLECVIKDKDLR